MEAPADEVVGNHNGPTTPTLKEKTEREPEGDLSPAESFSQCTLISSMDQPLKVRRAPLRTHILPCQKQSPRRQGLHHPLMSSCPTPL